jgi:hypothetical protein
MDSAGVTGTGVISPGFTTESFRPVKAEAEPQQIERPEPERIPEDNKGNNIDVTA